MRYPDNPQYRKLVLWLAKPIRDRMEDQLRRGIIYSDRYIRLEEIDGYDKYNRILEQMDEKMQKEVLNDVYMLIWPSRYMLDEMKKARRLDKSKSLLQSGKDYVMRLLNRGDWYVDLYSDHIRFGYSLRKNESEDKKSV